MRISTNMLYSSSLSSMNRQSERLDSLSEKLSTAKEINRASDDPAGYSKSKVISKFLSQNEQFDKNIDFSMSDLQRKDSGWASVEDPLQRVRELLLEYVDGTSSDKNKTSISTEISENFEALLNRLSDKDHNNNYLFSGTDVKTPPFDNNFDSQIKAGEKVIQYSNVGKMNISETIPASVLGMMKSLKSGLDTNNFTEADIDKLDLAQDEITNKRVSLGSKINLLESTQEMSKNISLEFTKYHSNIVDADIPKVMTELNKNETILEMSMQVFSKTKNLSLFNYL